MSVIKGLDPNREQHRKKMDQVSHYMRHRRLPSTLQTRIRSYVEKRNIPRTKGPHNT